MLKKKRKEVNTRIAVAKALSIVRQVLMKVKIQERRLEYSAKRDKIARKMLENLYEIEHLLEFISLRLETLAVAGIIPLSELNLPLDLLKRISDLLGGSPPDILSLLAQAEESLRKALESSTLDSTNIIDINVYEERNNTDIENIIKEAKMIAERKLEKIFGSE